MGEGLRSAMRVQPFLDFLLGAAAHPVTLLLVDLRRRAVFVTVVTLFLLEGAVRNDPPRWTGN